MTDTLTFKHIATQHKSFTYRVDKGDYVITDPCYIIPEDMWDDLCEQVFTDTAECGVIEIDGYKIWWGLTAYGDGGYKVKQNYGTAGSFGVDAGMFAIFPLEFVEKHSKDPKILDDSRFAVQVKMDGFVEYKDGRMICNGVEVDTKSNNRDDDE
jgi:hypothetical protein